MADLCVKQTHKKVGGEGRGVGYAWVKMKMCLHIYGNVLHITNVDIHVGMQLSVGTYGIVAMYLAMIFEGVNKRIYSEKIGVMAVPKMKK